MSIFKQLIKSLYSTKDMAKFRFQGIGKTILFVFLLSLISAIPSGLYMSTGLVNGINSLQTIFEDEIPSFTIENGTLSSALKEPFIRENDQFVFIIDSSGYTTVKNLQEYENALALIQDEVIIRTNNQSQTIDYQMFEGVLMNEEDVVQLIHTFESLMPIMLTVMMIIMYLVISFISFLQVAILAILGLILKNVLGLRLKYRHTWILAAYSMTIPTIFFTIMAALDIQVPYGGPLNWFVSTIVLYLALKEIPRPKQTR
ncbi:DUF1189 domain-containing protein [Fredinandcohnia quinoae]|uniref:DUF1189 domain-containing protein n=1 Tax=Fredinandcohnia quinoae TaxID=2918902 RepID=A0AAW5DWD8_9BACI|nr:DUF1189 domain-containing protein [Fredinandcohnia sp. SECRCQ15]MCH1624946.1 DUF1189 domain-containing protein [Fredinandcohnia sp. SECRCQ15]